MAYFNRKSLLLNTLESIKRSSHKSHETIIVDDASNEENRLEQIINQFDINIKLIRINPEDKKHVNACVPYNIGFREAGGDVVIIQNPECIHAGDVIQNASTLEQNKYKVFHCYSLPEHVTRGLINGDKDPVEIYNRPAMFNGDAGFYVHEALNRRPYHFCTAIHRTDLKDLGGFDERYALGTAYDDDEFASRVARKGLEINYVASPFVLHQWHYSSHEKPVHSNRGLYFNTTCKETGWRANVTS